MRNALKTIYRHETTVVLLFVVVLAIAAVVAGHFDRASDVRTWRAEPARLADQPRPVGDNGYYFAKVRTGRGDEVVVKVDPQVSDKDTITVWRNKETGKLFRTNGANTTPLAEPLLGILVGLLGIPFGGLLVLVAKFYYHDVLSWREQAEWDGASTDRVPAWS